MKIKKSVELDLLFGKVKAQQRTKLQYRRSVLFKKKPAFIRHEIAKKARVRVVCEQHTS